MHPYLGKISNLTNIFSDGLKPPTSETNSLFATENWQSLHWLGGLVPSKFHDSVGGGNHQPVSVGMFVVSKPSIYSQLCPGCRIWV